MKKILKVEKWNQHEIRFVWHNDEWWAVAKDVAEALGYRMASDMTRRLRDDQKADTHLMRTSSNGVQQRRKTTIISETGIYKAIMRSERPEADEFEIWVYKIIKELRKQSGLEGFQVFRMMDKEHQKEAMRLVSQIREVDRKHYIKANTIANKVVSTRYGFPKMVKKGDMTPEMLRDRQPILEEVARLMHMQDEYGLEFSVSSAIKKKYNAE